jgi:DNA-binding transcriptional regulator YiaG
MTPAQIRRFRNSLGLTQDAFAAKIGFDGKTRHMTIYRWEKGLRTPSAPVMKMLEKMLEQRAKARKT